MDNIYKIQTPDEILSPGLVVFETILRDNIARMQAIAKDNRRLRPHCKTHKMLEIIRLETAAGICKHKCATFAEAEMLAIGGAADVFLAYNPVGPNIARVVRYRQKYPSVRFSVAADHPGPIAALNAALAAANTDVNVFVDIDTGLGRTGLKPGPEAIRLYEQVAKASHLANAGLHAYDGHNHQTCLEERRAAVDGCWAAVQSLKQRLEELSLAVPAIVAGGTGTFPLYAAIDEPVLEASPGTCVFHDRDYARMFPDMEFGAAALILTRVISRPASNRITFDLGYKACASDPPAGSRLYFPGIPDAKEILHNEEHLIIETDSADRYSPGDFELVIPSHICPTSALHSQATVIQGGSILDTWKVAARDRVLSL